MGKMLFDRYHATQGNFALGKNAIIAGKQLADIECSFYVSQRKLPFAPCVGHERLLKNIIGGNLDIPRLRFLKQDKAGLNLIAEHLASASFPFSIRTVVPGTIIFAGEPFADISGPFALTQMMEVKFEHAFDEPMTVAANALKMRSAAGPRWLSDFSLRRDGDLERALDVARYSFVGGFDDTSNMEAAYMLDLNPVGTMAHYLVEAFMPKMVFPEKNARGKDKHFEQVAFERVLDAYPKGTTLLVDTFSLKSGLIHAIKAAQSTPARKEAFKMIRIDSGNLEEGCLWARKMLNANGFPTVNILATGDLDENSIAQLVKKCPFVSGFGVGTKLIAEVTKIAGVIFKLCSIDDLPVLKLSETKGKKTLPGVMQLWRCEDRDGFYIKDVISRELEGAPKGNGIAKAVPLLEPFLGKGKEIIPPAQTQKEFVARQLKRFKNIDHYLVELSRALAELKENQENLISKITREEDISELTMID